MLEDWILFAVDLVTRGFIYLIFCELVWVSVLAEVFLPVMCLFVSLGPFVVLSASKLTDFLFVVTDVFLGGFFFVDLLMGIWFGCVCETDLFLFGFFKDFFLASDFFLDDCLAKFLHIPSISISLG